MRLLLDLLESVFAERYSVEGVHCCQTTPKRLSAANMLLGSMTESQGVKSCPLQTLNLSSRKLEASVPKLRTPLNSTGFKVRLQTSMPLLVYC